MHLLDSIFKKLQENKIRFVRLQFVDILGHPKNITIPVDSVESAFKEGVNFDGSSVAGYATIEESDYIAKPIAESFVIIPKITNERAAAKFNCDIYCPDGKRYLGDPKYALERVVEKAKKLGYNYLTGPECEFYLFKKADNKPTLEPNDYAGYFDLSHIDLAEDIRADISLVLEKMKIHVHSTHHEVGTGQHEIDLKHGEAIKNADWVITLKYVTKLVASLQNLHASFMPKPIHGLIGSGMHVHQCLVNSQGKNMFNGGDELSEVGEYFIGGLLKYVKEITAVLNPTVNSYKRLVPGYEAPTYISWADKNRSALVRIPPARGEGTRCELRSLDCSGNPYLQFAVMLGAGLKGIQEKIEPPKKVEVNVYTLSKKQKEELGIKDLPNNLSHALSFMEGSGLVRDVLGEHVFKHFLHIKKKEWEEYRMHVTRWERDKYLPTI
ncbi:MAG: type I glutamate--ammonia ligase [Candidatus Woesearchaeota archaeon]|nr:MAG: type I glutamate--ammonia ligase [Candidatus Woesearchaeota archaeon]